MIDVYEISFNFVMTLNAHSGSNIGSKDGSNKMYPRKQLLADGLVTDALSGNIAKSIHGRVLREYALNLNVGLCKPCSSGDSRRIAAYSDNPAYVNNLSIEKIINDCVLCDTHGFCILAKKATSPEETNRTGFSKSSLVKFSFALGLPQKNFETEQMYGRAGDTKGGGQMIYLTSSRSGEYASGIRYFCAGIGVDTERWRSGGINQDERRTRHSIVLSALRDMTISPDGAMSTKMLPQVSGIKGVIAIKKSVGRAPMYSGLDTDFIDKLKKLESADTEIKDFHSINEFAEIMEELIRNSNPINPILKNQVTGELQ